MTNLQKQRQLHYLGYLPGPPADAPLDPDGAAATRAMQQALGIQADGLFGPDTAGRSMAHIRTLQQHLAAWSGAGPAADGLAGPETMAATRAYQRSQGLPETGLADQQTQQRLLAGEEFWKRIRYFTREEFRCKCGGRYCGGFPARIREDLVELAEAAREHFGRPGHVVSGLRCPAWNALSGGVDNSQHMYGEAVDLRIEGVSAARLAAFFRGRKGVRYCYEINGTNVHVDVPKGVR